MWCGGGGVNRPRAGPSCQRHARRGVRQRVVVVPQRETGGAAVAEQSLIRRVAGDGLRVQANGFAVVSGDERVVARFFASLHGERQRSRVVRPPSHSLRIRRAT